MNSLNSATSPSCTPAINLHSTLKFTSIRFYDFSGGKRVYCRSSLSRKPNKLVRYTVHNTLCKSHVGETRQRIVLSQSRSYLLICHCGDSSIHAGNNGINMDSPESSSENGKTITLEVSASKSSYDEDNELSSVDDAEKLLQRAIKELGVAQLNSSMFEEKAQKVSEAAIALKDKAEKARNDVISVISAIQQTTEAEINAKEAVHKATTALSMAEARLQLASRTSNPTKAAVFPEATAQTRTEIEFSKDLEAVSDEEDHFIKNDEKELSYAQRGFKECASILANCEAELRGLQIRKADLQKEVDRLTSISEKAQLSAQKGDEDVANIMLLAEQAVAHEVEAAQHVNDAEIALQKAKSSGRVSGVASVEYSVKEDKSDGADASEQTSEARMIGDASVIDDLSAVPTSESCHDGAVIFDDSHEQGDTKRWATSPQNNENEERKPKESTQTNKQEAEKDVINENSTITSFKVLKKSSRFFPASFFSFDAGEKFSPRALHWLLAPVHKLALKLVVGALLIGFGIMFYNKRMLQQPDVITMSIERVASRAKPLVPNIEKVSHSMRRLMEILPHQKINEEEASFLDMLWLLLASVIFVPIFQKIPGGSPVLGYLAAGILIGPHGLSIIRHVHGTKAVAEFGVVFLLFNIGLELSVERLSSMKRYVFGLGSAQVIVSALAVGMVAHFICGHPGPAAIIIGSALAMSSTAVVLQVLQERGESTSRHGRATFSVLLFQDLAVVVLLMLIPLISPNAAHGVADFQVIGQALAWAAAKAILAIMTIIAGGRLFLRPLYKQIADNQNAEIFSANTLLVILGTSLLTARVGLSMALGAFLAGLLLADTEFSLQIESDIAPYRGLLLGLFFMTVGMSINPKMLLLNCPAILAALGALIIGKTVLIASLGRLLGISSVAALRVALLLAPCGEFAFVAFGEAVNQGIISCQMSSLLFLVVGISMAMTPWLAASGQLFASQFEQHDMRSLLPIENETDDLQDHIIICGFGRIGQIIAQLLSEQLIPFVALDVSSERVAVGRALDLPVYFGDAGSREILYKVGAERACAVAVTLGTPGANYRTVWALNKFFPTVKTFVRAHDVSHGINLEKAGATAVVPETLEPSLQLAAAVLSQAKLSVSDIATAINDFRARHLSELNGLCEARTSSISYGVSSIICESWNQEGTMPESQVVGALP